MQYEVNSWQASKHTDKYKYSYVICVHMNIHVHNRIFLGKFAVAIAY